MNYLVTGSAGFIGFHVAKKLLERGDFVIGVDNFNDYYDVSVKEDRNKELEKFESFKLYRGDFSDLNFIKNTFLENKIEKVCHLGAQAGVRYSIENPYAYIESNIIGFTNLINESKNFGVKDFVYASSSSVYGNQEKKPLAEDFLTDSPISLYAATKKSNELIAHAYSHLYGINCTGLRFFTVYGPWGRPDMAMMLFADSIVRGEKIKVFNEGKMRRDFTYVEDIVEGIIASLDKSLRYEVINLGSNKPMELLTMIEILGKELNKKVEKEFLPMQPGDVEETYADIKKANKLLGWEPKTSTENGIAMFVKWYKDRYL